MSKRKRRKASLERSLAPLPLAGEIVPAKHALSIDLLRRDCRGSVSF